jgi:hypothetical protein
MKSSALSSVACILAIFSSAVRADDVTGTITQLEVWRSGNVAFTLSENIESCNGQVILNLSDPGFKSMFATLLAAQATGQPVRVVTTGCGPAENYGGSYNIPAYIYAQ